MPSLRNGNCTLFLGGAPGGVQRGPRRGAAPSRPPLPHAGQAKSRAARASQLRRRAKSCARRAASLITLAGQAKIVARWPVMPPVKKGANLSACSLHNSAKKLQPNLQPKSTISPLQPQAAPAQGQNQAKADHPRQKPCQTTAYPQACRFRLQHPQAWKARAARQGSARGCRRP